MEHDIHGPGQLEVLDEVVMHELEITDPDVLDVLQRTGLEIVDTHNPIVACRAGTHRDETRGTRPHL